MQAEPFRLELSPLTFLHRNSIALGERTAVVHGKRRYDYAELQRRCNRLASALRDRGLEKHDRVAVLCPNIPPLLEAHFGVPLAGGVLVPMNTRASAEELEYILEDSGARFLIVDHSLQELVEDTDVETIVVQDTGESDDPYEELLASGSDEPPESWLEDENEPISINYTSGTTGKSKGAVYTHRGAYLRAFGVALETRLSYDSVHLWTLPMFHCDGWCLTWGVTAAGATHVCLRKVEPERIWELFDAEGVTHYSGAPTIHNSIVNHESAHPLEQSVVVPTGGSPPTPTLLKKMRDLNLHPIHLYGLTETYGPATINEWHAEWDDLPPDKRLSKRARQGVRYVALEGLDVMDSETMEQVPADGETIGEVMFRGNIVMKGYLKNKKATKEAFAGGWFHSGDLGVLHPDGYIQLKDRSKDIIISGGENISSIEVEDALFKHPAVATCAVVGKADEKWGETPVAFIELKPGLAAPTAADIIAHCRAHLAAYKVPRHVVFGEVPKTSTGKIQKFVLRERAKAV
jgi:fatty-acyl-CoA synthase